MEKEPLLITPQTKIGELLDRYPQLEATLVEAAPAFKKLRNPVLRKTVAKVTSLAQAARVGSIPVIELIQRLRQQIGQPAFSHETDDSVPSDGNSASSPSWYDASKIKETLDARPMIDSGDQPIGVVLRELKKLEAGQIYELITPFEPAPLIDKAKADGITVWLKAVSQTEFHTYFCR